MISVVIPSFDNASYILEAIDSVRKQFTCREELEIVVVDDGSTDDTEHLLRDLMAKDSRVRYFRQDHRFAAAARNRGIGEAGGEWIYLLDADDLSGEGSLEALMQTAQNEAADAVFALTEDFVSPELSQAQKEALQPRPEAYPGILPGASLIRKKVFDSVGMFDSSLSTGETIEWMIRLRASDFRTASVPFVALHRRLHLRNTGRLRKSAEAADYARIIRKRMMEQRNSGK